MLVTRLLAATLLSLFVLTVSSAHAQSVVLDLTECREPPADEVRVLAALELRGRLIEDTDEADGAVAQRIRVECMDERARLHTLEPDTERVIDLRTVPAALRARLLALAIAELARTQPREPAPAPALTEPSSSEPARTLAPRQLPTVVARRFRALVGAGLELQAAPMWALSGRLGSLIRLVGPLAWSGALSLGQSRRAIALGQLRVRTLSVRAGPALLLERSQRLFYAGLAARVSLLSLTGEPDDRAVAESTSFRTVIAGPALFAGASLLLPGHLVVSLEAELAHQLRRVRAEAGNSTATSLSPLRASLSLLAGARW